jgi:PIN domain nuclease of toxin-antitoxin system
VKVLLNTHALIWHYLDDPQQSPLAKTTINSPANRLFVSAASHWEVAIKLSTGKYKLHVPFATFIQEAIVDNGFSILPVEPQHSAGLLPCRIIIAIRLTG